MALTPEYQQQYDELIKTLARQYRNRWAGMEQNLASRGLGQSGIYANLMQKQGEAQSAEEGTIASQLLRQQMAEQERKRAAEEAFRRQQELMEKQYNIAVRGQRNWYEDPMFWANVAGIVAKLIKVV